MTEEPLRSVSRRRRVWRAALKRLELSVAFLVVVCLVDPPILNLRVGNDWRSGRKGAARLARRRAFAVYSGYSIIRINAVDSARSRGVR